MTQRHYRIIQDKNDPVVRRQRGALYVILIAIALDIIAGILFAHFEHRPVWLGLFWAEEEATTVGSGFEPHTGAGDILKAVVGISIVPLFAATFSIFTTALTATHVHSAESSLKAHVTKEKEAIKRHIGGSKEHG